jgi:methionine sulfoxide reductase heme-binding subunit
LTVSSARSPALRRAVALGVWLGALGPIVWLVWLAVSGGLGANPIESLQHRTGHYALRLLAASLAISPLRALTRWGWLVPHRRTLGLAAFWWAVTHLLVYVGLDLALDLSQFLDDVIKRRYITVGMLAIALLTPLAITSTQGWIKKLGGARWNRLHRLVYPAMIAAVAHYLWAVKQDITLPVLYFVIVAVLLGARVLLRRQARHRAPAVTTSAAEASSVP